MAEGPYLADSPFRMGGVFAASSPVDFQDGLRGSLMEVSPFNTAFPVFRKAVFECIVTIN